LTRLVPTRRSLAIGFGILAFALCAYMVSRETSLFAISRIEVQGGSPGVDAQVRAALASLVGRPLVGLDGSSVLRKVDDVPTVVRARYDRDFPHTLRITVVPEHPAAVLRRGPESWLVSLRGRVMERLPSRAVPKLPRIWVSARTPVRVGGQLAAGGAAVAARAVGLAGPFASRLTTASYLDGALVFRLRSGLEILLGDGGDVRLKVAVAAQALAMVPSGSTFLDVSDPGRPVSGAGSPLLATLQGSSRG
jgi:cell division protein FtsQ